MDNQEKSKKKFYKRWWFWAIVIVVLYVIGNSASKPSDNIQSTAGQPVKDQTEKPKAVEESVIKVTALQLYADYEANEVAADAKYKNKIVEVSGVINNIGKDIMDTPYVSLNSDPKTTIFTVQCMFPKSGQEQLTALSKDSDIVLKGKVSGKMGNIIINECSIVK